MFPTSFSGREPWGWNTSEYLSAAWEVIGVALSLRVTSHPRVKESKNDVDWYDASVGDLLPL